MTSKYNYKYLLPGGFDQYFNSLVTLLKRASDTPPEQQELPHSNRMASITMTPS